MGASVVWDRDQREPDVAQLLQQTEQRRLIGDLPWMTVVPSLWVVTVSPSNQADQRASRCPSTRIAKRPLVGLARKLGTHVGSGSQRAVNDVGSVRQIELLGSADRCTTAVDAELGVDGLGVASHRVEGYDELAGDLGPAQLSREQPNHVDSRSLNGSTRPGGAALGVVVEKRGQQPVA